MKKTFVLVLLSTLLFAAQGFATPLGPGGQLFYLGTGLSVNLQNQPASSGFDNYTYLRTPSGGDIFLFVDNNSNSVNFTSAQLSGWGVGSGDELLFMIRPNNGGTMYFTGPATRNPDNVIHASVTDLGGGAYRVGFEDLFGGGDNDFNDAIFDVLQGATHEVQVPEPASFGLVSAVFAAMTLLRRRRDVRT